MKSGNGFQIVHLSDLHVTADALERVDVKSWYEGLFEDIRQCVEESPSLETFMVISGDLTVSADPSEFETASVILTRLLESARITKLNLIIVPGNHDISWGKPFQRRRETFSHWVKQFMSKDEAWAPPFRRFDELGLVFLTPGRTEVASEAGVLRCWKGIEDSLRDEERGGECRVAVVHYPPQRSAAIKAGVGDLQWLESICAPFVERSRPDLILHGHVHSSVETFLQLKKQFRGFTVGAGPLSCEAWRRLDSGPPIYHIFTSKRRRLELRTRIYVAQSRRWLDQKELWAEADAPTLPELTSPSVLAPEGSDEASQPRDILVDRLCRLPEFELTSLTRDLGAAIGDYSPLTESREEFAQRLVRYFAEEQGLDLLARCFKRFTAPEEDRRLRVFFAASANDKDVAVEAANICRTHGIETWLPQWQIHKGGDVDTALIKSISSSDIFVVVISRETRKSKWISKEISIALQFGATLRRPRIVPIVRRGCELPEPLHGFQAVELDENDRFSPRVMQSLLRAFRSEQLTGPILEGP